MDAVNWDYSCRSTAISIYPTIFMVRTILLINCNCNCYSRFNFSLRKIFTIRWMSTWTSFWICLITSHWLGDECYPSKLVTLETMSDDHVFRANDVGKDPVKIKDSWYRISQLERPPLVEQSVSVLVHYTKRAVLVISRHSLPNEIAIVADAIKTPCLVQGWVETLTRIVGTFMDTRAMTLPWIPPRELLSVLLGWFWEARKRGVDEFYGGFVSKTWSIWEFMFLFYRLRW